MTTDPTLLDALAASLQAAAKAYNPNDAAAPVAVLWPDKERQWEPLLPELRDRLPLLTLGPYDPEAYRGPAYWIRCVVDRALPDERLVEGAVPIVYLPGVSRPDLRGVESCPEAIQPLAELQYRGVIWSHKNGKDWTVSAFLHSTDGGLGLPLDGGAQTREALRMALRPLAVTPVSQLRAVTVIDEAYLLWILNPDAVSQLLHWLNDPVVQQAAMTGEHWSGFRQHCRKQFGFDPEKDGPLTAANKLGERKGAWQAIWQRYAEAATSYPGVTAQLRKASPPYTPRLLEPATPWPGRDDPQSSWPGLNDGLEAELRAALSQLRGASLDEARKRVLALDAIHSNRRDWLWSRLGLSPLATALGALTRLARAGEAVLPGVTVDELAASYAATGWATDAAAIDALLAVRTSSLDDLRAVQIAVEALYRPWLSEQAMRFQSMAVAPGSYQAPPPPQVEPGTVLLFCDGLRFDIGRCLADAVTERGLNAQVGHRLAALPTLTPTAKPAVMPLGISLEPGNEFGVRAPGAQGNLLADGGRKLLSAAGFQILHGDDLGDPAGRAWIELGAIDSNGHANGWKVAYHAVDEVRDLAERIARLLAWGWSRVTVVTDHGWLMLPEALPKMELPASLTDPRKGRCARIKPGSQIDFPVLPWHWDPSVRIAMAPGIACFTAGATYDHGGLSLQECVTPVITVSAATDGGRAVDVTRVTWRNLRCNVTVSGASPDMVIDLRRQAADAGSSVANSTKHPDPDGTAALFIDDAELTGEEVQLVVLSADGTILAQRATTVGG